MPGRMRFDPFQMHPQVLYNSDKRIQPQGEHQTKMPLDIYIPKSISPDAQEYLTILQEEASVDPFPSPNDLEGWRTMHAMNEAFYTDQDADIIAQFSPTLEEKLLNDIPVIEVRPRRWEENGKVVVYVHGGGYVLFSASTTLVGCIPLADISGLRIVSVDYSVAPHARFPVAIDQVISVIRSLLDSGYQRSDIAIFGDSAGGALAAAAVLKMRDNRLPVPSAVVLWSPWSDITRTGDSYYTLADQDSLDYQSQLHNAALAYADPSQFRHPHVSPVYADYRIGFPPTLIQGGTKEIFLSNCIRLYQNMDQAGVDVRLDLYEGMWHVFQALGITDIPEIDIALHKTASFLQKHLMVRRL